MTGGDFGDRARHGPVPGGDRQENSTNSRLVKLCELWQRQAKSGKTYFSGYMGDVALVMFDAGEKEHPTQPGETVHVWRLFVQERDLSRRPRS